MRNSCQLQLTSTSVSSLCWMGALGEAGRCSAICAMSLSIVAFVVCLGCCWRKETLLAGWPWFLRHGSDSCQHRRLHTTGLPHPRSVKPFLQRLPAEGRLHTKVGGTGFQSEGPGRGPAEPLLRGACGHGPLRWPTHKTKEPSTSAFECPGDYM